MSRIGSGAGGAGIGRGGSIGNERAGIVLEDLDRLLAKLSLTEAALSINESMARVGMPQASGSIKDPTAKAGAGSNTISAVGSKGSSLDVETILGLEEAIILLIQESKYEAAADFCDQIIMAHPANEAGYMLKGQAYIKPHPNEALKCFRTALQINFDKKNESNRGIIYNFISSALMELKEYDEAVVYAQKAINMQPSNIEYYTTKNVAIHNKYLYLNSQLTEVSEERMNLTELIAYKIKFWGLIKQLESRIGEEKLREIKEYMQELEKIETIEANYNDIEARLVGIMELWKVVSNENGIPIHDPKDSASMVAKVEADHTTDEGEEAAHGGAGRESAAAGGAGREETAPANEIGASSGASSSSITAAQNPAGRSATAGGVGSEAIALASASSIEEYDPELAAAIESAKKAIANAPKLSDEEERDIINKLYLNRNSQEFKTALNEAREGDNWDKVWELFDKNTDEIYYGLFSGYIRYMTEAKKFKFICKLIEKKPVLLEQFARQALDSGIRSHTTNIEIFKQVVELLDKLGLDVNELLIKKDKYGDTLIIGERHIEDAAGVAIGEDYDDARPEFLEYILKRFEKQNFKFDTETVDSVLRIVAGSARNETDPRAARIIKFLKEGADPIYYFEERKLWIKKCNEESTRLSKLQEEKEKEEADKNNHEGNEGTTALMGGVSEEHEGTDLS